MLIYIAFPAFSMRLLGLFAKTGYIPAKTSTSPPLLECLRLKDTSGDIVRTASSTAQSRSIRSGTVTHAPRPTLPGSTSPICLMVQRLTSSKPIRVSGLHENEIAGHGSNNGLKIFMAKCARTLSGIDTRRTTCYVCPPGTRRLR